ncbi:MAG: hypothetical protein LBD58_01185 [Treponema sp.]|jgi:hypothetical protein|nr:hypothetical protein [Treponema sp.]
MVFYLNKGLILEQAIVRALKDYFSVCGAYDFYKNVSLNITNRHPFAKLALDAKKGARSNMSLFPAIIVATESDDKPGELENLVDVSGVKLTIEDVTPGENAASPLEEKGYMMMTPEKLAAIKEAVETNGRIYGVSSFIRRSDHIAIEIWAENIQLKNELYELIRLFVCGFMKEWFEKLYEENDFSLFDDTVRGQRSNNFNVDFGTDLSGAMITFDADYMIEQTVIDTDLVDENIEFLEVINHVKGQAGTSRSVVIGGGDGAESGGGDAGE